MDINEVIISPVITEQSLKDANAGKFTFKVASRASKKDVKRAVEDKFSVKVLSIASSIMKGRTARFGKRREEVKLPSWKKMKVKLAVGQKIGLFELGEK